ncbi:MAG: PilZ domain-containing protein [Myxococcales bacterium]|nr:PilZ domain-containing protein [Myxococcales bacterium]
MNQRHRRTRKCLRLPVSLGGRLPALTADVSAAGLQLELPQVFLPGAQVHGYVLHEEAELPFRGEVAWARPGNPEQSLYSAVGVKFTYTSPGLKELLYRALC